PGHACGKRSANIWRNIMKHNKQELDAIIDDATRAIREEPIDQSVINQSATSVWARVSQQAAGDLSSVNANLEGVNIMNSTDSTEEIRGCADFQSLIPAYLDGKLSNARTLLLEDHSNECIPCRGAIRAHRKGEAADVAGT